MSNTTAKSDLTAPSTSVSFPADSAKPSSQTNLEKDGRTEQSIKANDAFSVPNERDSPQDTDKKRSSSSNDSSLAVNQHADSERPSKLIKSDSTLDVGGRKKPSLIDTKDTNAGGDGMSVSPLSVSATENFSSRTASSSLADMPVEVLGLVLRYARPVQSHHQFEWSGLVSQTCRIFRTITREIDEVHSLIDLDLNVFEKHVSLVQPNSTAKPSFLLLKFLESLIKFEHQRARIKAFHYNFAILDYNNKELNDSERKSLRNALVFLLRPLFRLAFPNLSYLDINCTKDYSELQLVDWNFLRSLPIALPKLERLTLGHCISDFIPNAMNEVTAENLLEFASSLQTPLRALSLSYAPWLSDERLDAFLKASGQNLELLELVDCSMWDHTSDEGAVPLKCASLQSVAKHCTKLNVFRLLHTCTADEYFSFEEATACDEALIEVCQANPNLHSVNNARFCYGDWHLPAKSRRLTYTKVKELDSIGWGIQCFLIENGSLYERFDAKQEFEDLDGNV